MEDHSMYGVNVKVYRPPVVEGEDILSEDEHQAVYERAVEDFWFLVQPENHDHIADLGLNSVYSAGRSGGWAVPDPIIDPDEDRFQTFERVVASILEWAHENYIGLMENAIADKHRDQELVAARQAVALVGNPSEGYLVYGPFEDFDAAAEAVGGRDSWITALRTPAELEREGWA